MEISDNFIIETLKIFTDLCPVLEWDRYTPVEEDLTIFGWINRNDNNRDFLLITFKPNEYWEFTTSSAKYSQKFSEHFGYGHTDCIKY